MANKDYYDNLKEALPFGAMSRAAEKFHITVSAVSQIASGKVNNPDVLYHLIQTAKRYQKYLEKIKKEMEAL
jgi:hypothetical protein